MGYDLPVLILQTLNFDPGISLFTLKHCMMKSYGVNNLWRL